MRKVTFSKVFEPDSNVIAYPDVRVNFHNVIDNGTGLLIADYSGTLSDAELQAHSPPELIITAIDSSSATETAISANRDDVTCPVGSTLTVTAELHDVDANVLPLDASFRMPLRARDGREKVLLATFAAGVATITAPMKESGVWQVLEGFINESLPPDQRMRFDGITIYVTEQ